MAHFKKVFTKFQGFKDNQEMLDITLKNHDEFHLHKLILAGAREYFRIMFTSEMKEKTQNVIQILDVSLQAFTLCMKFIYCGHVELSALTFNPDDIFHAICLFQLWDFLEEIENNLI